MNEVFLMRRRDAARALGVSESQLIKWESSNVIKPVRIPGIRAVRYRAEDVRRLAANIARGRLTTEPLEA
ncbi:MAG TPA: MerR family transcriptional regulator [Vicinamibacterales bacterium]|jgi:DNA-binding transcriptional MerR regulator|nr:MerR family transcriptional regulator [Vicinamibacterales bacterium]